MWASGGYGIGLAAGTSAQGLARGNRHYGSGVVVKSSVNRLARSRFGTAVYAQQGFQKKSTCVDPLDGSCPGHKGPYPEKRMVSVFISAEWWDERRIVMCQ